MFGTRKLGRTSDQRKAMLRQLTTDLLENGKLETTFYRAKEVQPVVEKMITLGKRAVWPTTAVHCPTSRRRTLRISCSTTLPRSMPTATAATPA